MRDPGTTASTRACARHQHRGVGSARAGYVPLVLPGIAAAQTGNPLFDAPAPPSLPNAPIWERLTLENPWPLGLVLIGAGIVCWIALARLDPRRRLAISGACLAGAALIWVTARLVETPREQIRRETVAVVGAAARVDRPGVSQVLGADFGLYLTPDGPGIGKPRALDLMETELGSRWKVDEWAVLDLQAEARSATAGRTQFRLRATLNGFPSFSWWAFDWQRDASGRWVLVAAEPADTRSRGTLREYVR